ncbi:hypothetical protein Efla_000130 [Eimeria flavescens]
MPPQHPLPSALLAVCFLGFAFCECEASNRDSPPAEVVGTPVTHNMLMGLNLCRTARLDVRLPLLESSDELEKQAKRVMMEKLPNREKCAESFTETLPAELLDPFLIVCRKEVARVQYTEGLQKEVEEGLKALGSDYSATAKFNYRASPFSSRGAQNLAFLMSPKATRVGCVVSKNCSDYKDYLLCLFSPGLTEQEAPFTQSFYDALWARKNAGIDLVDLFISDYNADLVNADLGGGKQVAGTPSLLSGGFLSLLALMCRAFGISLLLHLLPESAPITNEEGDLLAIFFLGSAFCLCEAFNKELRPLAVDAGAITPDMLIGLNLCRTARLDVRLPLLKLSEELEKQAEGLMGKHLSDKANCHQAFLRLLPARVRSVARTLSCSSF